MHVCYKKNRYDTMIHRHDYINSQTLLKLFPSLILSTRMLHNLRAERNDTSRGSLDLVDENNRGLINTQCWPSNSYIYHMKPLYMAPVGSSVPLLMPLSHLIAIRPRLHCGEKNQKYDYRRRQIAENC